MSTDNEQLSFSEWLRLRVAAMRELGVLECNGIRLGPPPAVPESPPADESQEDRERREKAEYETLLYASSR